MAKRLTLLSWQQALPSHSFPRLKYPCFITAQLLDDVAFQLLRIHTARKSLTEALAERTSLIGSPDFFGQSVVRHKSHTPYHCKSAALSEEHYQILVLFNVP